MPDAPPPAVSARAAVRAPRVSPARCHVRHPDDLALPHHPKLTGLVVGGEPQAVVVVAPRRSRSVGIVRDAVGVAVGLERLLDRLKPAIVVVVVHVAVTHGRVLVPNLGRGFIPVHRRMPPLRRPGLPGSLPVRVHPYAALFLLFHPVRLPPATRPSAVELGRGLNRPLDGSPASPAPAPSAVRPPPRPAVQSGGGRVEIRRELQVVVVASKAVGVHRRRDASLGGLHRHHHRVVVLRTARNHQRSRRVPPDEPVQGRVGQAQLGVTRRVGQARVVVVESRVETRIDAVAVVRVPLAGVRPGRRLRREPPRVSRAAGCGAFFVPVGNGPGAR